MASVKKRKAFAPKKGIGKESAYFDDFNRFAEKLRKKMMLLRREKGLTQEKMQDFELNLRQFQRIESGETLNITLATLYKLSKAFKISPSTLLNIE